MTSTHDSATLVDQFIQQHQATQAQKEAEQERQLQQAVDQAVQTANAMLVEAGFADFMQALTPHVAGWKTVVDGNHVARLSLHVPRIDELKLADFYLHVHARGPFLCFSTQNSGRLPRGHEPGFTLQRTPQIDATEGRLAEPRCIDQAEAAAKLGRFLKDRRRQFRAEKNREAEQAEAERRRRIEEIKREINDLAHKTEGAAEAALQELARLDDDFGVNDIDRVLVKWRQRHQKHLEEQALEERHAEQMDAYVAALQAWDAECDTIRAANQEALEALQDEYDAPRPAWRLWYGIVAHDEGDTYVDENDVYCIEKPAQVSGDRDDHLGGISVVIPAGAGKIREQWIYNPTRFTPVSFRPTDKIFYKIARGQGFTFYIHLDVDPEPLLARAEEITQALPPEPEPGDLLDRDDVERVRDQAFWDKRHSYAW